MKRMARAPSTVGSLVAAARPAKKNRQVSGLAVSVDSVCFSVAHAAQLLPARGRKKKKK
jgi:hypothetical protein